MAIRFNMLNISIGLALSSVSLCLLYFSQPVAASLLMLASLGELIAGFIEGNNGTILHERHRCSQLSRHRPSSSLEL